MKVFILIYWITGGLTGHVYFDSEDQCLSAGMAMQYQNASVQYVCTERGSY